MGSLFPKTHCLCAIIIVTILNCFLFFSFFYGQDENQNKKVNKNMACVAGSLLLFSIFSNVESATWSWQCIDNKCVKTECDNSNTNKNICQSIEICKLTCGPYGSLWPYPTREARLSQYVIPIHPEGISFDLKNTVKNNEVVVENELLNRMSKFFIEDLKTICLPECVKVCDTQVLVKIRTNSADSDITWGTDESYYLSVNATGNLVVVNIKAGTVFGARHALQTLFQLTTVVDKNDTRNLLLVEKALILDKPVYPHRGLLIDTSRNYLKVDTIKRTLDGMGHSKMNVLHWHATDSHSFPLKLPRVPEMAKYGAYSTQEVYSLNDISDILDYAKLRGVRVIMEIDSPAHAGNGWQWGEQAGFGELAVCINKQPWRSYCIQPPCGQLNPVNPNTYKILGQIYKDLVGVFPKGEVFHMGGDELTFQCWNSTNEIVDEMKKGGLTPDNAGFTQLWATFHKKSLSVLDNIVGNSKTPVILWSSQLTNPENIVTFLTNERFIIQTWLESSDPTPTMLLELNYTLIVSTKDAWYLDHGFWGNTNYHRWSVVYDNRIPEHSRVLGGEVCMWGEYVDDSGIDSRIWPRAAAAAERLWSNPSSSSVTAQIRFLEQRKRLVNMGIHAAAITPEWCYQNDNECS